ncbi:MAG: Fpg/Nei family DNA glycosylase [Verrucomicrobiales bacterium]
MPELAEVEFYRRCWVAGLGERVTAVELHVSARVFRRCDTVALTRSLPGAIFRQAHSHGKQMLFQFSQAAWLGIHLGMSGKLSVQPAAYAAIRHDHLVLRQRKRALVFTDARMFGRVRFDNSRDRPPAWWDALPPAILGRNFTVSHLSRGLLRRHRSPVKAALLDQAVFPGIGNWMADEILWRVQLHPLTQCETLDPLTLRKLWRITRWVSRQAISLIGSDWSELPDSWLFRHRWSKNQPCPRCGTLLRREAAATRTTCWCPTCQS